jgi:periplasmic protein CpxP/Spy
MNNNTKNKLLIGIVALLILANITSIAMFWLDKPSDKMPVYEREKGTPAAFLIRELNLDEKQQDQLEILREAHKQAAEPLREELGKNKQLFFELLQQQNVTDSQKINAEMKVTAVTEKLDLLAFDHFYKVRNICTEKQKEKFDKIIMNVAQILGNPGGQHPPGDKPPPTNDGDRNRPPRDEQDNRPPPPENNN